MDYPRTTIFRDSNTLRQVDYDRDTRRLRVHFIRNNAVWDYLDVAPTEYASLAAAKSPGAVFNERIRGRYDAVPIRTVEEEGERRPAAKQQRGQIVLLDNYDQF